MSYDDGYLPVGRRSAALGGGKREEMRSEDGEEVSWVARLAWLVAVMADGGAEGVEVVAEVASAVAKGAEVVAEAPAAVPDADALADAVLAVLPLAVLAAE